MILRIKIGGGNLIHVRHRDDSTVVSNPLSSYGYGSKVSIECYSHYLVSKLHVSVYITHTLLLSGT